MSIETRTVLSTRADTVQLWSDWLIMKLKAVKATGAVVRLYRHRVASALFNLYQNKQKREGRRHNAYRQHQMLRPLETTRRILSGPSLFCFRGPSGQGAPALPAECTRAVKAAQDLSGCACPSAELCISENCRLPARLTSDPMNCITTVIGSRLRNWTVKTGAWIAPQGL